MSLICMKKHVVVFHKDLSCDHFTFSCALSILLTCWLTIFSCILMMCSKFISVQTLSPWNTPGLFSWTWSVQYQHIFNAFKRIHMATGHQKSHFKLKLNPSGMSASIVNASVMQGSSCLHTWEFQTTSEYSMYNEKAHWVLFSILNLFKELPPQTFHFLYCALARAHLGYCVQACLPYLRNCKD